MKRMHDPHYINVTGITDAPVATWDTSEIQQWKVEAVPAFQGYQLTYSKYNITPGSGRTGVTAVAPNNYPFYKENEVYVPVVQPDGGQLSEWSQMYAPSKEEADRDRALAYERGTPHGYKPRDEGTLSVSDAASGTMTLWVVSDLHDDSEYGATVDSTTGDHFGGPFTISVAPDMRVEQLRTVIRDVGGIPPALQKLSYAGKHFEDSQRTLAHYGVTFWHARFPHWPIKIRSL